MQMINSAYIVVAVMLIGVSFALLYRMKDIRALIVWSIALAAAQITVAYLHSEIKWFVLSALPFYLFVLVYAQVKIRRRVNAALKRIEEREKKEKEEEKQTILNAEVITSANIPALSHKEESCGK